jgi:hypothetical protein
MASFHKNTVPMIRIKVRPSPTIAGNSRNGNNITNRDAHSSAYLTIDNSNPSAVSRSNQSATR